MMNDTSCVWHTEDCKFKNRSVKHAFYNFNTVCRRRLDKIYYYITLILCNAEYCGPWFKTIHLYSFIRFVAFLTVMYTECTNWIRNFTQITGNTTRASWKWSFHLFLREMVIVRRFNGVDGRFHRLMYCLLYRNTSPFENC